MKVIVPEVLLADEVGNEFVATRPQIVVDFHHHLRYNDVAV